MITDKDIDSLLLKNFTNQEHLNALLARHAEAVGSVSRSEEVGKFLFVMMDRRKMPDEIFSAGVALGLLIAESNPVKGGN